jgi:hypothetical protein
MNRPLSIVLKLRQEALDSNVSVSNLLRTGKVIAAKLDLKDALVWINHELDGYKDVRIKDIPTYRLLTGSLVAHNPYHGWQAVVFEDPEFARVCSQAPIGTSVGAIEHELKGRSGGTFQIPPPHEKKIAIMNSLDVPTEVTVKVTYGSVCSVLDSVRNLILNWTLELEKAGILGEGMEFSQRDRREAPHVTHQIIAQNIGQIGDVSGQSSVTNQQSATITLDLNQVRNLAEQARDALPLIPPATRQDLEPTLDQIDEELAKEAPSESRLRGLLRSARTVCEGAFGNLAAQGIIGLIAGLLGA